MGCTVACPHSAGIQAVPYRVIDTWEKYSIVDTPMFTFYEVYTVTMKASNLFNP
jgi:hypothetical protein